MKYTLIISIAVLVTACSSSKRLDVIDNSQRKIAQVKSIDIPKAKEIQIRVDVSTLASDDLKGRDTGSAGIDAAATYIENRFKEMDVDRFYKNYRDEFEVKGETAFNVIAQIPGSDGNLRKEVVVIGAHYDHIGMLKAVAGDSIANGANDNATGTATVLAIAEILKELDFNRRTVVFALFSAEEKGLLGSKHLAKRMKDEGHQVVAMLNFEMTGTPMQGKPYIAYLTGYDMSNMGKVFNTANPSATVTGKLDEAARFQLFKRSDNYPFFQEMLIPAQTFSTFDFTNFDHYHKVGDDMSKVDTAHMKRVVDQLMPGVLDVINKSNLKLASLEN
ncbi:MAG: M20/M25/M40 family metallo-hydrolase [Nonlabens sp.]